MTPQPNIQKKNVVTANTMKFFDRIFTAFFARQKPDSTHAKPRFIKNTSMAVTSTHTVSAHSLASVRSAAIGSAGALAAGSAGAVASAAGVSVAGVSSCAKAWLAAHPAPTV